MNDIFEKKLKEFLPYIIIIGVIYLFVPAILVLTKSSVVVNQIVYLGVFPLTALGCGIHYAYFKTNDFFLSLVAPVLYLPSMLLYGNLRNSVINSLIFLVSYFICGYIGLTLGEMISPKSDDKERAKNKSKSSSEFHIKKRVPKRVRTEHRHEVVETKQEIDFSDIDDGFSDSSAEDEIDAIMAEIHNRLSEE